MENDLYKMMIKNASNQLKSQNPEKPTPDDFTVGEIVSVLGLVLAKEKAKIFLDIIYAGREK